jgi:hypothetical protein
MNKKTKNYNSINWNEIFKEDINSPTGLVWKVRPANSVQIGDIAGTVLKNKNGYRCYQVKFNKKLWYVHRVLWVMRNGYIDNNLEIDHIDGNSLNNLPDNIRTVPHYINARNHRNRCDNSSGVNGVSFWIGESRCTYAVARWNDLCGKERSKRFNSKKLGLLESFALACTHREKMIYSLNTKGAGYSNRHGANI